MSVGGVSAYYGVVHIGHMGYSGLLYGICGVAIAIDSQPYSSKWPSLWPYLFKVT